MSKAPNESQGLISEISSLVPSLARSEQRVAQVILDDPEHAASLTITEIAGQAATSETTVIRFCRSIGLGSYPNLRIALATEAGRADVKADSRISPNIDADDDLPTIIAKVAAADSKAIADTAARLDAAELGAVAGAVVSARRIDIYGAAASGYVALDLQHKLHRIGLAAFAWSDPHRAIPSAANLSAEDVAIGISHTGTTADTVDALRQARDVGATTVALTNYPRSPIVNIADLVLRTSVSETHLRSGAMASRIAALTVVDCLFVAVAQRQYPETLAALERTRASVHNRHRLRR